MKMNRFLVLCTVLGLLLVLGFVPGATYAQTLQQNAQNLDVGFSATGYTGVLMPDNTTLYSDSILPYFSTFSTAAGPSPSGNSICAAYVSADAGLMPSGAYGTIDDVGSRAWFEDWLTKLGVAQQTDPSICNRVLVIFKMFPAANRSAPANAAATTCGNPAGSVCNIGGAGNIAVPNNVAVTVDLPLLSWSTSANDGAPANPIGNNAQFQLFQAAFLGIDWQTITGWHGKFDFVPWNDFYSKTGDGDGLPGSTGTFSLDLTAQHAAAAYITLHLLCDSGTSGGDPYGVCGNVVAGSFLNNAMNCTDHTSSALASGTCADGTTAATLLDLYLWHIYNDAQQSNSTVMPPGSPAGFSVFLVPPENYPFDPAWTPEVFAFKDFADVNNYINNYGTDAGRCLDAATCVAKNAAQIIAADPLLQNAEIWNMAAAAGQVGVTTTKNLAVDPNGGDNTNWMFVLNSASDPTPDQQACAASYMLRLMASLGPQYKRLYYEGAAWDATITGTGPNGNWALFPAGDDGSDAAAAKPAFGVLTDRDLAYASTSGSDCPGGLATELANVSDTGNAGESIAAPGVFTNTLVARAKDIYGNAFGGASVTFSSSNGLLFSASATGTFSNTLTVTTDTTTGDTPPVYVEGSTAGTTYTATATLDQAPGATAAQFINLVVEEPSSSSTSALTVNGSSTSASVKYGDTVTLESTVTPAPPAGETTDTVTFWLGAVGSGTNLGTQTVDATGKAQLDITSLHVLASPYTIVARFNGSASLGASTSDNSVTVTVRQLTLNDDGVTPVLTATPDPAIRFADQLDSAAWAGYTFTPVSGADFVNGDDSSTVVVTGSPVYTSSDPNTQTPGTYTVTLSGISSPDYLIGFDTGSLDVIASAAGLQENADSLIIGFTGPIANTLPFADQFYTATSAYLTSKGLTAPRFRICEAYVAWDAALYASGAYGDVNTLNSRAWFENWLHGQQGHCDRALITFKSVSAATPSPDTPPTAAEYQAAMEAFLTTDWKSITTWTGKFDFVAWNEPDSGAGASNGYTVALTPQQSADYYLVLRSECDAHSSVCGNVAAGAFNSNGNAWQDYLQNCPTSTDATCANGSSATYLDKYKYYINADLATYWPTAPAGWKPEVFAYHEWNDINNYILKNNASNLTCTSAGYCTVKIVGNLLNDPWWSDAEFWNSEVGLGQAGNPSPDDITQACAASYMLRVNTSVSPRFTRLYYMRAAESDGSIWSLFDSSQQPRPAFDVLANRNLAYVPPAGSTPAVCPAGPQTQIVNFSDPSNAGETINAPGVFTNALVAQAQDIYGNPLSGVSVTFGPATGLLFSNSASGPWNDTAVTTTLSNGNTSNVYVEAADEGTYTATASLTGVSSAAPVEFQNLAVVLPQAPPVSSLQIISDPTPPAAGKPATLSVALPAGASGTVEFTYNGGTALTCTNSGNPVTVAGDGTATCATTIPEGATSVSGTYTADGASAYASAALSTVTVQTGAAVDFAIAAASATQTVALGTPVSYTLNLSSINGSYDCPVTFIVAFTPALPPNATWSFSPASVTPASGASTTLTINIPKQTAMLDTTGFGVKAPLALAMLLLPLAAWRRRKSMGNLLIVLVLALAGLAGSAILGCGNDNNSSSSVAPKYQIDITGTGSCGGAHLTTVQLEVSK